jgi:hypothetical protein
MAALEKLRQSLEDKGITLKRVLIVLGVIFSPIIAILVPILIVPAIILGPVAIIVVLDPQSALLRSDGQTR